MVGIVYLYNFGFMDCLLCNMELDFLHEENFDGKVFKFYYYEQLWHVEVYEF